MMMKDGIGNMYDYKCMPRRVVDGDTLDIQLDLGFHIYHQVRVRLYGLNAAPEGQLAKEAVENWFNNRLITDAAFFQYSSLKYDQNDKYGRSLGIVYYVAATSIESLNDYLLQNGFAVPYMV